MVQKWGLIRIAAPSDYVFIFLKSHWWGKTTIPDIDHNNDCWYSAYSLQLRVVYYHSGMEIGWAYSPLDKMAVEHTIDLGLDEGNARH